MPKGVINPRWELAAAVAREMGNETKQNIMRVLKEFKIVEDEGYTAEVAIDCWRWLKTREEFPIDQARIITVLKGSPVYIEQFKSDIALLLPPVYESTAHDEYVMKYGRVLRGMGFVYRVENQPGRLTTEKLIQSGAKES